MRSIVLVILVPFLMLVPSVHVTAATPASAVTRDLQPVILHGSDAPWLSTSARYVPTPPPPMTEWDGSGTIVPAPDGSTSGWPVDQIAAFRWDPASASLTQITLQVDERFSRYLTNYASGFGIYSQSDLEETYAFDWEGKKKECEAPGDPLTADFCPGAITMMDPVAGLDDNDELVLMWSDLGAFRMMDAPVGIALPHEIAVTDPLTHQTRYAYILGEDAPVTQPASLVSITPDADADAYIQSNHGDYGGAPGGACHLGDGVDGDFTQTSANCDHRRPKDSAWVTTPSYQFHYDGRWKLDGLKLKQPDGSWSDSVVDRWKGRAFQQKEGNAADVGGFEDENDWSQSSVTLGVRSGPLRVLRETWGADSGTDVTRLDAFYPSFFSQVYHLRVHPIPPDGLYAFWDNKAGMMDTYYTPLRAQGVPIDGHDDELYGTNSEWQQDYLGKPYFTIDAPDPTFQPPAANENWDEVAGPFGSLVTYIHTPVGVQAGALTPYYRDDATFDDGTGSQPGSYGAHGIHFFFTSDTDNFFLPVPTDEFVATTTQYVLSAGVGNVGDQVAQLERVPLVIEPLNGPTGA